MYGHTNPEIRTTEEGEQVGPKMYAAVAAVAKLGPYPSRNQLAKAVGPNGSQDYGYRIVRRCRHKGLIKIEPDHPEATPSGRGAVTMTEKGRENLRRWENNE